MTAWGPAPEMNAPPYPGVSGVKFNPVEASKVWAEMLKTESNAGYIHRTMDGLGKLGFDERWACDMSQRNDLMPSYQGLTDAYYMTGWQKNKFGAKKQPDIMHMVPALKAMIKPRKKRGKQKFDDRLSSFAGSAWEDSPRSVVSKAPSLRSLAKSMPRDGLGTVSAPSLTPARDPPPPSNPPQVSRRQQTPAPPMRLSRGVDAMSRTAPASFALPNLTAKIELSTAGSRLSNDDRRNKIASLVCSEVNSQCSAALQKLDKANLVR